MFRIIRYIIYLILILVSMFWLTKQGVDVRGGLDTAWSRITSFARDIGSAPKGDIQKIYNDISNQDFTGALGSTSTATTVKGFETKSKTSTYVLPELTTTGIFNATNQERKKVGLPPLVLQKKLSASALKKANDILDRQYFDHASPDGKTAVDLAKEAGYVYQIIGENLALGDFGSDAKLVTAWMNSPDHKANIVHGKYTEIGIGIVKGEYKGDFVWIAVQHFGKPAPICTPVDQYVKRSIDAEKFRLEGEERELQAMAQEIESDPNQNKGEAYLAAYNTRVSAYNTSLDALKAKIQLYNMQVTAYNTCLGV